MKFSPVSDLAAGFSPFPSTAPHGRDSDSPKRGKTPSCCPSEGARWWPTLPRIKKQFLDDDFVALVPAGTVQLLFTVISIKRWFGGVSLGSFYVTLFLPV